jgi:drug/metabolite transporter (DMT)-like permease
MSSAAPTSVQAASRRNLIIGMSLAALGAILFSGKAIVAKLTYRYGIDAVTLIALRMIFSFPFFLLIAWSERRQARLRNALLSRKDGLRIVVLGLLGYYLASFLDFLGLEYISAGLERLILFLTPTIVVLITVLVLRRPVTGRELLALGVSYGGIVLVFVHDASLGGSAVVVGSLFVLASAVAYSCYLILSGELLARIGATRLVAYAMCVSSVACVIQYLLVHPAAMLLQQPAEVYWYSLLNAVLCTVAPVFATMWAVQRIGPPSASQMGMVGPVSTLFLGAWLLDEPITAWQLSGMALVLIGIFILSRKRV